MSTSAIHIIIRFTDAAAIVECVDEKLSDEMTIQAWCDEILSALKECHSQERIVLNFLKVKFMSSSALRALITIRSAVNAKKMELFLSDVNPTIMEVFKITKLDSLFRISVDEAHAVRAVSSNKF